jgi:hypothetical protein
MFSFNNAPSKAFGIVWMLVDLILCKNINFCVQCRNFYSVLEREKILKFSYSIGLQIIYVVLFFRIFGGTDVWFLIRSLHAVLFLTDSVFNA